MITISNLLNSKKIINSKFNFFYQFQKNEYIAFNARTMALAKISGEKYRQYENFIKHGKEIENNFTEELYEGGFLIEQDIDELQLLKYRLNKGRFSDEALLLTIAPTMECNFECIYCFEEDKTTEPMTEEVQKSLINFINTKLNKVKEISVDWYGGEPLLAFKTIQKLSEEIMNLCKEKNIKYSATMITNGFLLHKFEKEDFIDLNIRKIQVTIDGTKKVHDKRRMLKNGGSTYDTIMKNIKKFKDDIDIRIRINVDKTNGNNVNDLILEFQQSEFNNVFSSVGHIKSYNECYDNEMCFDIKEFSECLSKFNNESINLNYQNFYTLPMSCSYYCDADFINGFVIDNRGYIYKCWSDIGNIALSVDNLVGDKSKNITRYLQYMTYDSTEDKECRECKYLPLCMGGCPLDRINNTERCTKYKYILEKQLKQLLISEYKDSSDQIETNLG